LKHQTGQKFYQPLEESSDVVSKQEMESKMNSTKMKIIELEQIVHDNPISMYMHKSQILNRFGIFNTSRAYQKLSVI
jgi:hypothetical protein